MTTEQIQTTAKYYLKENHSTNDVPRTYLFEYFRLVEASTKKPVMRYSHTAGEPIPHSQPQRSAFSRFAKQSMYQPRRFSEPERSQSAAAVQPGNKLATLVYIKFRHFYSETNHISLHQTRTFQALLPTFEFKPLCRS